MFSQPYERRGQQNTLGLWIHYTREWQVSMGHSGLKQGFGGCIRIEMSHSPRSEKGNSGGEWPREVGMVKEHRRGVELDFKRFLSPGGTEGRC